MRGIKTILNTGSSMPMSMGDEASTGSPIKATAPQETKSAWSSSKPLTLQAKTQMKNEQHLSGQANQVKLQNNLEGKYAMKQTRQNAGSQESEVKSIARGPEGKTGPSQLQRPHIASSIQQKAQFYGPSK